MFSKISLVILGLNAFEASAIPATKRDGLERFSVPKDHQFSDIIKRDEIVDGFPGCDVDPSYAAGPSKFTDGEGVYLRSDCDNGKLIDSYHCWTDYYLVEWNYEYSEWENTGMVIDCATTSDCNRQEIDLGQSCTSNTFAREAGIQATMETKILEEMGFSVTVGASKTKGDSTDTCTSSSSSAQCTWDDEGCHTVWKANMNRRFHGYVRRTCKTPRDGVNMSNSPQREDGLYTVGMHDFSYIAPDAQMIGCAATCNDAEYPEDHLTGDISPHPIEA